MVLFLVFLNFIQEGFNVVSEASAPGPSADSATMIAFGDEGVPTPSAIFLLPLPDDGPRYDLEASGPGATLFQQGVTAYAKGEHAAADMFFREFTRRFPQSLLVPSAFAFLAELILVDPADTQQRLAAIESYRTLLRQFPTSANASRARWRIGDLYAEHGWWFEAQTAYKRAFGDSSVPDDRARARLGAGVAFLAERKWSEATNAFEEIRARSRDERLIPYASIGLAEARYGAKRVGDARSLYESSFTRWPDFFKQRPEVLRHYG
ncbi:MAG: tetratricopeptide repeat protein, partial [Nitrospiraceae bacterium]